MMKKSKIPPFRAPRATDDPVKKDSMRANKVDIMEKTTSDVSGTQQHKKVTRSLTDAEYEDIFDAVLKQAMDDSVDLNIQPKCIEKLLPDDYDENSKDPAQESFDLGCDIAIRQEMEFDHFDLENMPDEIKSEFANFSSLAEIPEPRTIGTLTPVKSNYRHEKTSTPVTKHETAIQNRTNPSFGKKKQKSQRSSGKLESDATEVRTEKNKKVQMKERKIQETATWVQCSKKHCLKWRYLANLHDPATLPDIWTCAMSDDPLYNSCELPEQTFDEEEHNSLYIFTRYTEGSVVWARIAGYPWWPAMVEIDPDFEDYFECKGYDNVASHYHVVFFDDRVSRAWVSSSNMLPFSNNKDLHKLKGKHADFKKQVLVAHEKALEAERMSIKNRLEEFGFANRFHGRWGRGSSQASSQKKKKKAQKKDTERSRADRISESSPIMLSGGLDNVASQSEEEPELKASQDASSDCDSNYAVESPKKKHRLTKKQRGDSGKDKDTSKKQPKSNNKQKGGLWDKLPSDKSSEKKKVRTVGDLRHKSEVKFLNPLKSQVTKTTKDELDIKEEKDDYPGAEISTKEKAKPSQTFATEFNKEPVKTSTDPSHNSKKKVKKFMAPVVKQENKIEKSQDSVIEKTVNPSQNLHSQDSDASSLVFEKTSSLDKSPPNSRSHRNKAKSQRSKSQKKRLNSQDTKSNSQVSNLQSQGNASDTGNVSDNMELDLDIELPRHNTRNSSQDLQSAQSKIHSQTVDEDSEPLDFEE